MDDGKEENDDGWEILKPGVVLFETTMGSVLSHANEWIAREKAISSRDLDKPIPHPILDDRSKMLRIIGS